MSLIWAPVALAAFKAATKVLQSGIASDLLVGAAETGLSALSAKKETFHRDINTLVRSITRRQVAQLEHFDRFETQVPVEDKPVALAAVQKFVGTLTLTYDDFDRAEFDADKLAGAQLSGLGRILDSEGLSEAATQYALRLFDLLLRQINAVVQNSPQFSSRVNLETYLLTKRLPERVADSLDQIFVASTRHGTKAEHARFLAGFLQEVTKQHGKTKLFGLDDVPAALRWAPVDVTYVSLSTSQPLTPNDLSLASRGRISTDGLQADLRGSRSIEGILKELLDQHTSASSGIRLAISGTAGSGKTTVTKWLATRIAISHHTDLALPSTLRSVVGRIPLVVPLRSTVVSDESPIPLSALVRSIATEVECPADWLLEVLRRGKAFIIFDGLDELAEPRRTNAYEWIRAIASDYPDVDIVVTMRPEAVDASLLAELNFHAVLLKPMELGKSLRVVTQWFDAQCLGTNPSTAEAYRDRQSDLTNQLVKDSTLQELAETPLLTALLCAYFASSSGDAPGNQRRLVEGVLAALLDRRDRSRGLIPHEYRNVLLPHKLNVLGQMATFMFYQGVSEIDGLGREGDLAMPGIHVDDAYLTLKRGGCPLPVEEVIEYMLRRSGVFLRIADDKGQFAHRIFLEFLTAHRMLQTGDREGLLESEGLPGWYSVVTGYCWLAPDHEAEAVVTQLMNSHPPEGPIDRRLNYCLADCLVNIVERGDDVQREVSMRLRASLPPETDEEIGALASLRARAVEMLAAPESAADAVAAIRTAGRVRTPDAFDLLKAIARGPFAHTCTDELLGAWRHFEAVDYARDVLTELDFSGIRVLLPTAGAARAAQLLRGASLFRLGRCDGLKDLEWVSNLSACTELDLKEAIDFQDIKGLRFRPDLRSLRLPANGSVRDLSVLAHLPALSELHVEDASGVTSFESLALMSHLETLAIHAAQVDLADFLPVNSTALRELRLTECVISDVRFLSRFPNLTHLRLDRIANRVSIDASMHVDLRRLEITANSMPVLRLPRTVTTQDAGDQSAARQTSPPHLSVLKVRITSAENCRIDGLELQEHLREIYLAGHILPAANGNASVSGWQLRVLASSAPSVRDLSIVANSHLVSLAGIEEFGQLRGLNASETPIERLSGGTAAPEGVLDVTTGLLVVGRLTTEEVERFWSVSSCTKLARIVLDNCGNLNEVYEVLDLPALEFVSIRGGSWTDIADTIGRVRPHVRVDYDETLFLQETG